MRRRYRVIILAATLAALAVPVGFALSLESPMPARHSAVARSSLLPPQSHALVAVGAFFLAIAAVIRKAG